MHGSFWVWAQPMRGDVTLQRLSMAEPTPKMIPAHDATAVTMIFWL